ncbi:FAD binding domain-containing protein [Nitratireductor rhodophyticola]
MMTFIGWASIAEVQEIARGEGKIIPVSKTQIVQSSEAGIVQEIAVTIGQTVSKGDLILQLDDGDPAVRHQGTIGGSIANNDPAADYPAGLLALAATIHTNRREIAADDFFTGLFSTALDEGEIITAVSFEAPEACGYAKFPNPASRYAMTGVFVSKGGGAVRVAVTGAGSDGVFRHEGLEQALSKDWSAAAVDGVKISADGLMSDIHCDAAYRANLIRAMAKRALA